MRAHRTSIAPPADAGGIVTGFLFKIVLVLGVVGVICFDVVSVAASRMALEDQAVTAARMAATQWRDTHDARAALVAAEESAQEADPGNVVVEEAFSVAPDGTVRLSVQRTARTFAAQHVPQLHDWISLEAAGQAGPPS